MWGIKKGEHENGGGKRYFNVWFGTIKINSVRIQIKIN